MKTTTTLVYSDAADKHVASWLDCYAKMKLEGHNHHTAALQETYAMWFIQQIMIDNPVATNYAATVAEVKRELESYDEVQS